MSYIISLIKKPWAIAVIAVVVIGGGYLLFGGNKASKYETVLAERGNITQEVSVTGRVKPAQNVDLAFEKTGKASRVSVKVGDTVAVGQVLAQIENEDVVAQLMSYEAVLKSQQAELDELKKGTRQEEIQLQETKTENSKKVLIDRINDSYTKSDDAVRNKVDQFFGSPRSSSPTIGFTVGNSLLKNDIETRRMNIEGILTAWESSLDNLNVDSNLESYISTAKNNLNQVAQFLDKAAVVLSGAFVTNSLTQTTLDAWRADVAAARTNVSTANISLSSAEESWRNESSTLDLKKAGTVAEQITAQEANVEKAAADVRNYRAQVAKTVLRSPIAGIITNVDIKTGEIVAANENVVSVMSKSKFEVEADVPEVDIAKIKIGDIARITLDAYGSEIVFEAKVIKIDPAEKLIEGVATYKITLQFTNDDEKIKSGMTANLDIVTAIAENVIVIPQRAVIGRNGSKTVNVLEDGKAVEKSVKAGLRGVDGNVEITEGLSEGEAVITSL
ncbi:MAG: efflux RND transporter periplasmic adaptor subunit [Candidatus Pacebacteria bacterium]|nr:efflux RND transporter periplasmic adaptor subunit [Candidatus Paceibacterota bacterium]